MFLNSSEKTTEKNLTFFKNTAAALKVILQGFIQEKIGSENLPITKTVNFKRTFTKISNIKKGPFTKFGDLKTDPPQKSMNLKQTFHKNLRD